VRPRLGERRVLGHPGAAEGLDGPVDDGERHVRRDDLDHRDLGLGGLVADLSIIHAALRVSRRACSISMRERAIQSWTIWCSAIRLPNVVRSAARRP
jgi:hypothetical protein